MTARRSLWPYLTSRHADCASGLCSGFSGSKLLANYQFRVHHICSARSVKWITGGTCSLRTSTLVRVLFPF